MWASVPADIAPSELRVFPVNLGYPPNPPIARGTPVHLADDAAHVLAQLPAGPLHLVAHSYGGLIALAMLPKLGGLVRSLALFEPTLFGALHALGGEGPGAVDARGLETNPWFLTDDARGGTEAWLEFFIDYWNRPGSWARIPTPMRAHNLAIGWKMYQEVRAVFFESGRFEDHPLPPVPVTLVRGERTTAGARAMVDELARRTPHARVIELEGTGHMAPLTHPSKVHDALREHFARAHGR